MGINASQFTQVLAFLGGGSKKDGGEGMAGGVKLIFMAGAQYGNKLGLEGKSLPSIDSMPISRLLGR